jgi:hypothetical protein
MDQLSTAFFFMFRVQAQRFASFNPGEIILAKGMVGQKIMQGCKCRSVYRYNGAPMNAL